MIIWVILVLVVLVAALFFDWSFLKVRGKGLRTHMKKAPKPKRVIDKNEPKEFQFDPPSPDVPAPPILTVPDEVLSGYKAAPEVEDLLSKADIHFRKGEMKAAENYYLQAASKDPRCSKAYSRLGVIYLEHGESWDDAEAAFRQALKTDPDNGFILNNLGLVLYHQDKYADSIRNFEQAVRQDEYNAARHANLGMAYMAMRQYAKAESSFKKALKLAPGELEYKDLLTESIEKKNAHKTMVRR